MHGRARDAFAVVALAAAIILIIALPVLRAPSERLFGMEIVGRHYDPFVAMANFTRPGGLGVYWQPVTDAPGAVLARVAGPVAAYNWLVLLSFPLAAAAAYLLARHLALSVPAAAFAAIAYAFAPFHLAHAAYHPHIAQTQWLPLYLLTVWRCLDRPWPARIALLLAATGAVTLSNFYGGLIAATLTPFAVAAYWVVVCRKQPQAIRRLGITLGTLLLVAAAGIGYAFYVVGSRAAFAFPRSDLFVHSAKWWSYLVPPVEHPVLGGMALRLWRAARVDLGLLEQQVSLGWALVVLAVVAIVAWVMVKRRGTMPPSLVAVPVLAFVAFAALLCSLSPERTIGSLVFVRPSSLLYEVAPMFRSYARFAVVVQLMTALLAGIAVDWLLRHGTRVPRVACGMLLAFAAFEYAVWPPHMWRDVLPTAAHRWVQRQEHPVRALDCTPLTLESESVQWLTRGRVTLLGGAVEDCGEPHLWSKLAALGYTHLIVRRGSADAVSFASDSAPAGLPVAAQFDDARVFAVAAPTPAIYTAAITRFSPREREGRRSWRWMGASAGWTVTVTGNTPIDAVLSLELAAFHRPRRLEIHVDRRHVQTLVIDPARHVYDIGPITIGPGDHELLFHPPEGPTVGSEVSGHSDPRPLSFAIGSWTWTVRGTRP